ncbi:MAG TPA: glycosyltransferase family 4 protein [Streptosporangiaceae bacterium]|nr:glycosyltransferase family 4 protein [Streptosporangiaceae bacterium]
MKVVIVAPHFHPRIGGVETYTLNIATRLVTLGWQVVVVTTGESQSGPQNVAGMRVYRLPIALTASNTPVGFRWRRQLAQIFQAERPDVINAHTPVPYLADIAQRASGSIPFALTYHNDLAKDALLQKVAVKTLQHTLIDRTLRRATKIIATSDYYVRESRYLRRHESKISVVPPGVDLATFHPEVQVPADLASRYTGNRVVLFVGSLNKSQQYKGLDVLIGSVGRIHAQRPDVRLVVAGTGDGLDMYRKMAAGAGVADHVDFAGYIGHDLLPQYYKLARVLAMPSTSHTEGFGMVYVEAGAVGTPVIGSAIGGVPYAVKDEETGLLVAPRDARDLERALARVLDDAALAKRLGVAGAARARAEFDWHSLASRTSDVLKGISRPTAVLGQEYAHDTRFVS